MSFRTDISSKRTVGYPWRFRLVLYGYADKAFMLALAITIPPATCMIQAAIEFDYTTDDRRQLTLQVNTFISSSHTNIYI